MLHQGILPYHRRWATFLMRLRLIVVDELHSLRGIFGSNVAHVLRRLLRVCAHYGSSPSFCFASATIGNPAELAQALCGQPVTAIDDDGSPQSERCFGLWQRPLLDEVTGRRSGANAETAELLARFVRDGRPTLAFTRSRRGAELVAAQARRRLQADDPATAGRVAAYRAGYLPEERRELERRLGDGSLLGVAATNALELGIDVGGLDAVVLNGFPGTLASMRQQAGRAGRTSRRAAAVLVAGDDQLDQWYAAHPTELFERTPEAAVVNPSNPYVLRPQVACAAHELPLEPSDEEWFGPGLDDAVRELVLDEQLKPRAGQHVLGRTRAAGAARRAAHRFVGRVPARRPRRRRRRPRSSARSTRAGSSTSRTRARCTSTRAGSGASIASTSTTTSPGSSRPTTPTSTPRPARTPTSRSPARTSGCRAAPAGPTSARST